MLIINANPRKVGRLDAYCVVDTMVSELSGRGKVGLPGAYRAEANYYRSRTGQAVRASLTLIQWPPRNPGRFINAQILGLLARIAKRKLSTLRLLLEISHSRLQHTTVLA